MPNLAQPLVEAQIPFKIRIVKDHEMKKEEGTRGSEGERREERREEKENVRRGFMLGEGLIKIHVFWEGWV